MKNAPKKKGRLIALEGSGGRSMAVAIKQLERNFRHEKVVSQGSGWDDSDIFFQISQGARGLPAPPPQTSRPPTTETPSGWRNSAPARRRGTQRPSGTDFSAT